MGKMATTSRNDEAKLSFHCNDDRDAPPPILREVKCTSACKWHKLTCGGT